MTAWQWAARAVFGVLGVWLAAGVLLLWFADAVDPLLRTLPTWLIGFDSGGSVPAQRVTPRLVGWIGIAGAVVALFAPNWWRFAGLWFATSIAATAAYYAAEQFILESQSPHLHLQSVLMGTGIAGLFFAVPLAALGLVRFVYAAGRRLVVGPVAGQRFMPWAGWLAIATFVVLFAAAVIALLEEASLNNPALRGGG